MTVPIRYPLLGLVAVLGLAFSRETYDPLLAKGLHAWTAVGVSLALLALAALLGGLALPRRRELDGWVALAPAVFAALALVSPYPWFAEAVAWDFALAVLIYGAGRLAIGLEDSESVARTFATVTLAAVAFGLVQLLAPRLAGFEFVRPGGQTARTLASTFANPDYFAAWLLVAIPFAAQLRDRRARNVALAVSAGALLLTFSRAGWIALAAQAALGRAGAGQLPMPRRALAVGLAGSLAVVALLPALAAKLTSGQTARQRLEIWKGALSMAAERPLTGHGPGAFGAAFPSHRPAGFRASKLAYVNEFAHDLPLHLAATGGLAALAMLALGLFALARDTARIGPRQLAIAGLLVQNLFSVTLFVAPIVLLAALVAALPDDEPAWPAATPGERGTGAVPPSSTDAARPQGDLPATAPVRRRLAAAIGLLLVAGLAREGHGRAQRLCEASKQLREARRIMDAGLASAAPGWQDAAMAALGRCIALEPFWPAPRYRLAGVQALAGDLKAAQAGYVLLEAISPGFAELPRDRAEVYRVMGRPRAGRRQARLWIDMNAAEPASHVLAARLEEAAGDRAAALRSALQARDLGASPDEIGPLIDRVSQP